MLRKMLVSCPKQAAFAMNLSHTIDLSPSNYSLGDHSIMTVNLFWERVYRDLNSRWLSRA